MPTSYKLKAISYKLNIGIVCYPSVGGSGIVATNLGIELAKLGHQIHFISYERPFRLYGQKRNIYFHQVNISKYELFKYPDYTLPLAVAIGQVHQMHNLNIVHVHYAVPHATAALLACQILKQCGPKAPKVITTLHGTDITLLANDPNLFSIIKYSVEKSDGVTAVSQSLKNETLKTLRTKKPIKVIYNFYSPPKPTISRGQIRRKLKIKDSDFVALHMSNLRMVKRVNNLLKITAKLKNEPKFKLLILAGGKFEKFLPLIKKLKIKKQIIVKGKVSDIQNYINAADCGIYTSDYESFGMGILETMFYGKPPLATKVGGVPEVVKNGRDGYLIRVGDTRNFAAKLKLLMNNLDLANKLGRHAKITAEKKFSAKQIVKQYIKYYTEVCAND